MRKSRIFTVTLLDDNNEPIKELGQITGEIIPVGEPNPSRKFEGEADQQFMDYIGRSPLVETKEFRLRIIADIEQIVRTYDGRWTVDHIKSKGDNWVEIKSQGKITSPS